MSIVIQEKSLSSLTHFRGTNLTQLLEQLGQSDMDIFEYRVLADMGFVAKLGEDELLVHSQTALNMVSNEQYAFQRGDAILELSGNWLGLMSEVCIFDFKQTRPGSFLMVLMAGVSVWMLIPQADAPLIIGCDPSYGHYLFSTLQHQVAQSPFLA